MSLRAALETLGLGRAYHMQEVFTHPEHVDVWARATDGVMPDWPVFLGQYGATLDGPACFYWREIWGAFPDACVLLVRRDPQDWYRSMMATIYPTLTADAWRRDPAIRMVRRLLLDLFMQGRFEDEAYAIGRYLDYCDQVESVVPRDRLLVYDVAEGWSPLCDFLRLPEPGSPFPVRNTRSEFRRRAGLEG